MNNTEILKWLKTNQFSKIENNGDWLKEAGIFQVKEIKKNIFLLIVESKKDSGCDFQAFIAHFDGVENVGKKEPVQIMFYLFLNEIQDFHYFEQYLEVTELVKF